MIAEELRIYMEFGRSHVTVHCEKMYAGKRSSKIGCVAQKRLNALTRKNFVQNDSCNSVCFVL